jgi:hypothetical protein
LHLLDQNEVSYPNPEVMVSFAHHLLDELGASPQNDNTVDSIVSTGEERISQHEWARSSPPQWPPTTRP